MTIKEINYGNRKILTYELPSCFNFVDNNIGNKLEDFEYLQLLGEGTFSYIVKVRSKKNFGIYALKRINLSEVPVEERKGLQNEEIFLKKLNHPNVCKYYGSFEEDGINYIIMKFFDNKDLFNYLSAYSGFNIHISEEILWEILLQCLDGLTYLHNQGIIHRDIKPANILIDKNNKIQIGDFGVSVILEEKLAQRFTNDYNEIKSLTLNPGEKIGTPFYWAPELEAGEIYDQKIDVYSLGITFYVLCFTAYPYMDDKNMEEMMNDTFYSCELKNIIFQMIQRDPGQRPTSSDIYLMSKKAYMYKYVKNSGIYSAAVSLLNYDVIEDFFTDNIKVANALDLDSPNKLSYMFIELILSLKDTNKNNKARINESLYAMRKILNEEGIVKNNNEEINPIEAISTIIRTLKYELNKKDIKQSFLKDNQNSTKRGDEEQHPDSYLNVEDISGEEGKKYNEFMTSYKSTFNSIVAENFRGVLKITKKCTNNHINILFQFYHFMTFNCEVLMNHLNNNSKINIYECFNCFNNNEIFFNNKNVICPQCNGYIQNEKKTFYDTPNFLLISFDRGNNNINKIKINFDEIIRCKRNQVEPLNGIEYSLYSVINCSFII